ARHPERRTDPRAAPLAVAAPHDVAGRSALRADIGGTGGPTQVPGRVDEGDVGEGLREIADQALRLGIVFLGEEADVGAQPEGTREAATRVVAPAQERQVVGEPERAREEGALAGRQAVDAGR